MGIRENPTSGQDKARANFLSCALHLPLKKQCEGPHSPKSRKS